MAIMGKPTEPDLSTAFKAIRNAGTTHLISLLEHSEADQLGLASEKQWCAKHQLTFLQYPIDDYSIPMRQSHFAQFIEELFTLITQGAHIVIHCRGGIGRSGLAASSVLLHAGFQADNAMETVSAARGETTPETHDQIAFIQQMETLIGAR